MRFLAVMGVLVLLTACDMITPPWKIHALKQVARQPVTCDAGADCDQKWARALEWVKHKSKLGIATQNASLIQTGASTQLNSFAAFTITKVPLGGDRYRIDYAASCDDDFGCTPPLLKLKASFVEYVLHGGKIR